MMLRRAFQAFVVLLASALLSPSKALADYTTPHAELVCQKGLSIALVRFTLTVDEDRVAYRRLPAHVDEGLSATRTLGRSNCTMANGWKIRLRDGQEQPFAYGMGYADPPAYFSLWIAQRKIVSRKQYKPGYGMDNDPWLIGIVIRPDRLTYCRVTANDDAPDKGAITCRDEPLRLDRHKVDRIEYASGPRPTVGTILLGRGTTEPSLCRKFLRLRPKRFQDVSATTNDTANIFGPASNAPGIVEAKVEVAPGVWRKLVRWGGHDHYFDGDVMMLAPVSAQPSKVLKDDMIEDAGRFPADKLPAGWRVIAGQSAGLYPDVSWRYVHFDTQRIDGRLYLLAQPSNEMERPTAILVQPIVQGFRTICVFQRVEPHF
jgi:hypothetical protein